MLAFQPQEGSRAHHEDCSGANSGAGRTIVIVAKSLPRYRIPFFELLRAELQRAGCQLKLLYGPPSDEERLKQDTGDIAWGQRISHREFQVGSRWLYWQPVLGAVWSTDLVIVEQASKLLVNYLLLAAQNFGGPRVAFWGHGENFDKHAANPLGELIKRRVSRFPHWWFAYTEGSAAKVRALGYPSSRITVVQNSLNTAILQKALDSLPGSAVEDLRAQLGCTGNNVGLFIGGLYRGKRLEYLLSVAQAVRQQVPDFELVVIGAGPDESIVRRAAQEAPWIKAVGPRFDAEKVPYFPLAKVLLLPAVAGLTVLDSFALGLPIITLAGEHHPPEFEYLKHGINSIIVPRGSASAQYAGQVVNLLQNEELRTRLVTNCRLAATTYTLEAMVDRFAGGILAALAAGPRSSTTA
jgi:glycosyltransferase involved in cell wall biosynthesis